MKNKQLLVKFNEKCNRVEEKSASKSDNDRV